MEKEVIAMCIARRGIGRGEAYEIAYERILESSEGVFTPMELSNKPVCSMHDTFHGFMDVLTSCHASRSRRVYNAIYGVNEDDPEDRRPKMEDLFMEMRAGRELEHDDSRRLLDLAVIANGIISPDSDFIDTIKAKDYPPHPATLITYSGVSQKRSDIYLVPVRCHAMEFADSATETLSFWKRILCDKAA